MCVIHKIYRFSNVSVSARSPAFFGRGHCRKKLPRVCCRSHVPGPINFPLPGARRLALTLITTEKSVSLSGVKYMKLNIRRTASVHEYTRYWQICQLAGIIYHIMEQTGEERGPPDRIRFARFPAWVDGPGRADHPGAARVPRYEPFLSTWRENDHGAQNDADCQAAGPEKQDRGSHQRKGERTSPRA